MRATVEAIAVETSGLTCARCGASSPPGDRFCARCGARLPAPVEGERKWVTVLVADMKSSLALLAGRDPEEAERLLDPVLELMMDAVHEDEGTVAQVTGDGIVALFGAPRAHEDHALRACHAALRMQEDAAHYSRAAEAASERPVRIRVGLSSGEVVMRTLGDDPHADHVPLGATAYLAMRMEQLAPPGSVLITADTFRLVDGYVQARPLGDLTVTDGGRAVGAYELTDVAARRARLDVAMARGLSPLVGREASLAALRAALDRAAAGQGQVVGVSGEAGVGKSRLVAELVQSLGEGWRVLRGRSIFAGVSTAYLAVLELLRLDLGLGEHDPGPAARERLLARARALDPALEAEVPALAALLGAPVDDARWELLEPLQRRERTARAFSALLLAEAARQPLLLVVEDLHAVDPETQECLGGLVARLGASRVALVATYRPDHAWRWPGGAEVSEIRLEPLPRAPAEALLTSLLGAGADLAPLKQALIERAEGNPFFLEEIVRALVETRVLSGTRGAYRLVHPLDAVPVPPSVQAVIAARIDRLAPEDKVLLQTAAVAGSDLRLAVLRAVTGRSEQELRLALARLLATRFVRVARLAPDVEYRFEHALTRDVAYEGLLHDHRRALHGAVLGVLEALHAGRLAEVAETLAFHAVRAEAWEKAVDHLRTVATRAYERGSMTEALERLDLALELSGRLAPTDDNARRVLEVRLDLHAPLLMLGRTQRMIALHDESLGMARRIGDPVRLGRALYRVSSARWIAARYSEGLEAAREALQVAGTDPECRIYATLYLGFHSMFSGSYREAIGHFRAIVEGADAALSLRRFGASAPAYIAANNFLVWSLASVGEFEPALAHGRRSVEAADASGAPPSQTPAYMFFALALAYRGQFEEALRFAEEALRLAEARHIVSWLPAAASTFGWILAWVGRAKEGLPHLELSVNVHESLGLNALLSLFCRRWAEGLHLAGRARDAEGVVERALELAGRFGERGAGAEALLTRGEIVEAVDPADTARADDLYARAGAAAEALDMRPLVARAHLRRGQLWRRAALGDGGREHLAIAERMLGGMDMRYWLGSP
jgi:predicted ATPase/class 3 adenylate cyclase